MVSVSDQLLTALDELVSDQLERFKWHLKNDYRVSASDMEKVDNAPKTVDLMTARFGPEEAVKNTVKILRKMNQNLLAEELEKKHEQDTVPRTKEDFLRYSLQLSLDLNTVNNRLLLSQNNTVITNTFPKDRLYPDHPDRFHFMSQVLCGESVSGRSYWEIESRGDVSISVSYKSISRKGGFECVFGANDQSWSLFCSPDNYVFIHNDIMTALSVKPIIFRRAEVIDDDIYRTGVFVDPGAGTLSFFSISRNTMSLIHTVQTTFTQPLYPGFTVYPISSVKLC